MNVLLLLSEKVSTDRVECVAPQLMISLHQLKEVQLQSAVRISSLGVSVAHLFAREIRVLGERSGTLQPRPVWKASAFQMLRSLQQVWEVKIGDIISNDDVRIHFRQEVSPGHQHFLLCIKLEYLCIDNETAGIKAEDISHEWLRFSVSCHDISDLDNRILVCFRKDPFATRAFNIEGENTKRRHFRPFAVAMVCDHIPVVDMSLDLTFRVPVPVGYHVVF